MIKSQEFALQQGEPWPNTKSPTQRASTGRGKVRGGLTRGNMRLRLTRRITALFVHAVAATAEQSLHRFSGGLRFEERNSIGTVQFHGSKHNFRSKGGKSMDMDIPRIEAPGVTVAKTDGFAPTVHRTSRLRAYWNTGNN